VLSSSLAVVSVGLTSLSFAFLARPCSCDGKGTGQHLCNRCCVCMLAPTTSPLPGACMSCTPCQPCSLTYAWSPGH
jgi:hypothetical protein